MKLFYFVIRALKMYHACNEANMSGYSENCKTKWIFIEVFIKLPEQLFKKITYLLLFFFVLYYSCQTNNIDCDYYA